MILRVTAYPPRGWPVWLWRFSGSWNCHIKFNRNEVVAFPWAQRQEFVLTGQGPKQHVEIYHNAGMLSAREVHLDLDDAEVLELTFRARFLPFVEGDVKYLQPKPSESAGP
jgi:hypothetical protein